MLAAMIVAGGALAATAAPGIGSHARLLCGVELWSLKTLSDPQRGLVQRTLTSL